MAIILADRVRVTSTTNGTGDFTLGSPMTGYQSFSDAFSDGDQVYYTIRNLTNDEWEVGLGAYSSGVLIRTNIYDSSTGGKVSFSSGVKDVFTTLPAKVAGRLGTDGPGVRTNSENDARFARLGSNNTFTGTNDFQAMPKVGGDELVKAKDVPKLTGGDDADFVSPPKVTSVFLTEFLFPLAKNYARTLPAIKKTAWNSISVRAGTVVLVNNKVVKFSTDTSCSLDSGSFVGGVDYAVIVKDDGTAFCTRDSYATPAVVPANGLKVGGFHFGRTPSGEAASGNKTEADMVRLRGIRELSIWDLRICPVNSGAKDNRGKTRARNGGSWWDIYLIDKEYAIRRFSSPLTLTESGDSKIAGGALTNGREFPLIPAMFGGNGFTSYAASKWWDVGEVLESAGMLMPKYREFTHAAYGVVENATMSSLSKTYNTGVQAYVKELMSADGLEHIVGSQYQWCDDVMSPYAYDIFKWQDRNTETGGRGQIYASAAGNPTALLFGGDATPDAANVGSRAVSSDDYLWNVYWSYGGRGRCDCLYL